MWTGFVKLFWAVELNALGGIVDMEARTTRGARDISIELFHIIIILRIVADFIHNNAINFLKEYIKIVLCLA